MTGAADVHAQPHPVLAVPRSDDDRARAQLDCAPVTVVRLDRAGRITHVNQAWHQFAGANGADAPTLAGVGLDYLDVVRRAPRTGRDVVARLEALLAGRLTQFTEEYECHGPTAARWFRLDARRLESDDALVLVHTDITDARLAEARLQVQALVADALTKRAALLDTTRAIAAIVGAEMAWDVVAVWAPLGRELRCTHVWTHPDLADLSFTEVTRGVTCRPSQDAAGRAWATAAAVWIDDVAEAGATRGPVAARIGLRCGAAVPLASDGEVLAVVELYGRIRRTRDVRLLELVTMAGLHLCAAEQLARSQRQAADAEAKARATQVQLDAILAQVPALVFTLDVLGRLRFANRGVLGLSPEQLVGRAWVDLIPPGERPRILGHLGRALAGADEHFELKVVRPTGEVAWYATHVGPLRSADPQVRVVVVAQDVTARKQSEAAVAIAQRMAAIGTLAAGVAHEINTPLQFVNDSLFFLRDAARDAFAVIERALAVRALVQPPVAPALADALADLDAVVANADLEFLTANVAPSLARCVDGIARVTTIARALKEFAHPDHGVMDATDLNRAVETAVAIARHEYHRVADVALELGALPPVVCHAQDIHQVLLNLLVNAAHAIADAVAGTERRGVVTVRSWRDGADAVIAVGDTGTGIPEAARPRLFELFFTTKSVGLGSGQGLALAWTTVVDKHGGTLTYDTEFGVGSTFYVRLPIAGPPAVAPATHPGGPGATERA